MLVEIPFISKAPLKEHIQDTHNNIWKTLALKQSLTCAWEDYLSSSAIIDEKYVHSESDWGLNFLNYSLEASLRANSFPAEAASG